jgi:hypothetical protein
MKIKVKQMTSPRAGVLMCIHPPVANQFIIYTSEGKYFQSYDSIIVAIEDGKITLDENTWNYSRTTSKYRNIFLDETTAETRAKIESGEYELEDLN